MINASAIFSVPLFPNSRLRGSYTFLIQLYTRSNIFLLQRTSVYEYICIYVCMYVQCVFLKIFVATTMHRGVCMYVLYLADTRYLYVWVTQTT